jgi:hypothetical protein
VGKAPVITHPWPEPAPERSCPRCRQSWTAGYRYGLKLWDVCHRCRFVQQWTPSTVRETPAKPEKPAQPDMPRRARKAA